MSTFKPEYIRYGSRPDAIDAAIEETLKAEKRCAHCGFGVVKTHASLCIECVKKLVIGLNMLIDRRGGSDRRTK